MLHTLLVLVSVTPGAGGLDPVDAALAEALAGRLERKPFVAHFDPEMVSEATVKAAVKRAAGHLATIRRALELEAPARIDLFLHADEAALRRATGAQPHWSAFSRGTAVHQAVEHADAHELTHVVAATLPLPAGTSGPDALLREGLATALQKTDRNIAIHDWAAVAARTGRLPPLASLRKQWPTGPVTDVHPYHVAGSFCGWLLDHLGAKAFKRVYVSPDSLEEVSGTSWSAWEMRWFRWLLGRRVSVETETAVRRWLRLPVERGPESAATERALPLTLDAEHWRSVTRGSWKEVDGNLVGDSSGPGWSVLHSEKEFPKGTGLHVQVRLGTASAVMLRLHRRLVVADEGLLSTGGCWVTRRGGGEGFEWREIRLVPGRWTDVVLDSVDGHARLWVDGWLAADVKEAFRDVEGAIGLGVRNGNAEFRRPAVRLPKR